MASTSNRYPAKWFWSSWLSLFVSFFRLSVWYKIISLNWKSVFCTMFSLSFVWIILIRLDSWCINSEIAHIAPLMCSLSQKLGMSVFIQPFVDMGQFVIIYFWTMVFMKIFFAKITYHSVSIKSRIRKKSRQKNGICEKCKIK